MQNIIKSNFISHPFHLVSPSPWPIFTSFSLLTLTTSVVLTMQGFDVSQSFLNLALIALILIASIYFRFWGVIYEWAYQAFHILAITITAVQRGLNNNFLSDTDFPIKKKNSKCTNTNEFSPKKPNRFILFIKKLLSKILTKKFLYSSLIIFITGFMGRYLIKSYFDIDVFKDYLHIISLSYYAFMSIFTLVIRLVIYQLLEENTTLMKIQDPNLPVSRGGQSSGGQSSSSLAVGRFTPLSVYQPSSGAEGRFTPPIQPQGGRQSVPISDQLNPISEPLTPTEQDVNPNPDLNRYIEKNIFTVAMHMYRFLLDKNRQMNDIEDNWNDFEKKTIDNMQKKNSELVLSILMESDVQLKAILNQYLIQVKYENRLKLYIYRAKYLEIKADFEQSLTKKITEETEIITEQLGLDPKSISVCLEPSNDNIVKVRLHLKTGGSKDYSYIIVFCNGVKIWVNKNNN